MQLSDQYCGDEVRGWTHIGKEDLDLVCQLCHQQCSDVAHVNTGRQKVGNLEQRHTVGDMSYTLQCLSTGSRCCYLPFEVGTAHSRRPVVAVPAHQLPDRPSLTGHRTYPSNT